MQSFHSDCLQIDWDASPEQKKLCLNKGRDNQVDTEGNMASV